MLIYGDSVSQSRHRDIYKLFYELSTFLVKDWPGELDNFVLQHKIFFSLACDNALMSDYLLNHKGLQYQVFLQLEIIEFLFGKWFGICIHTLLYIKNIR